MTDNSKPKSSTLDNLFKEAIEEANRADIDEPPLVWPELPDDLGGRHRIGWGQDCCRS